MIKKLRLKIVIYTIIGVFAILATILSIVNVSNFVGVAEDADHITQLIADHNGVLEGGPGPGPVGPEDRNASIRYFTYSEESDSLVQFRMSSIDSETAINWGKKLINGASKGWAATYYRYRIYQKDNARYVTVIDQSRELAPSYRVLTISLISSGVSLVVITLLAIFISKKLIKPIEESDNKQRRFIADAELALKTPVSVISIDNGTLVNMHGEDLANKSIRKQVEKLLDLSKDLNELISASSLEVQKQEFNLSNTAKEIVNRFHFAFGDNKKSLEVDIQDDVIFKGDDGMIKKMLSEVLENCLKYSDSKALFSLKSENSRIVIEVRNDCKGIPEGTLDRVFDKFYRLDYKDHSIYDGSGVGLSIVKEIVDRHNGRIIAKGENDFFIIKIEF